MLGNILWQIAHEKGETEWKEKIRQLIYYFEVRAARAGLDNLIIPDEKAIQKAYRNSRNSETRPFMTTHN